MARANKESCKIDLCLIQLNVVAFVLINKESCKIDLCLILCLDCMSNLGNKESCKIDLCLIVSMECTAKYQNKESCKIDLCLIYRLTESLQRISSYTLLKIPSLLDSPVWRVHIDRRIFFLIYLSQTLAYSSSFKNKTVS